MINQGLLFVILLSLFVSVQSQYAYDCRRLDDCQNNGICNADNCTCADPFGNYDCGVTDTTLTPCALACENGGTCYPVGSDNTCFCAYGYHGTLCELTNVDIICSGDKAEFVLLFPSAFAGEVSLVDGDSPVDEENCTVTQTEEGTNKNYSIAIDISTNQDTADTLCKVSNLQTIVNPDTKETIYRVSLLVTYFPGMTTTLDEVYHGKCSHETQTVLDKGFSNVAVDNNNLTANEFADVYRPVSLAVFDLDDALLTGESKLYVGSIFKLVAYLTDSLVYKTARLERCETNNTLEGDGVRTFLILDEGCPTKQSKRLTTGQSFGTYTVDTVALPAATLPIEAFKFSNSDQMGIICTAKICKADDLSCAIPPDCDAVRKAKVTAPPTTAAPLTTAAPPTTAAPTTAVDQKRKRRAADDVNSDVKDTETLSAVITILGPNDVSDRSRSSSEMEQSLATVENCFTRSEILAVVTVLAGIVCILLIACLVLACLLIKRKAKSVEFESMPAPPSDRFRIPRAHVNDAFTLREV